MLQLAVTAELLRRFPRASEGDLAWMRQRVVAGDSCAAASRKLGLPELFVARAPEAERPSAEEMSGRRSVQGALVEALMGAAWLEFGPQGTTPAILAAFASPLDEASPGRRDPKTELQEETARRRLDLRYELVATEGPPHARRFTSRALVGGRDLGSGEGPSKQASERESAVAALAALRGDPSC